MKKQIVVGNRYYLTLAMMMSLAKVAWGEGNYFIYEEFYPNSGNLDMTKALKLRDEKSLSSEDLCNTDNFYVSRYLLEDGAVYIEETDNIYSLIPYTDGDDLDIGIISPFTGKEGRRDYVSQDEIFRHDPRLIEAVKNCPEEYRGDLYIFDLPGNKYMIGESEEGLDIVYYPEQEMDWVIIDDINV